MTQIVPAILDKNSEDFQNHIAQLRNSVGFQEGWVHIDFADNEFVPNETISINNVKQFPIDLYKEAHLMVAYPLAWIKGLEDSGFNRVIFHFESKDNINDVIEAIKRAGMEVGIAINPDTPVDALEQYKDSIDQVLIMGIVPGFQGRPFIPETLEKIKTLKSKGWPVKISIDGAVKDENAKQLVDAGVDQLVSGSFLFQGDIDENLEKMWEVINK